MPDTEAELSEEEKKAVRAKRWGLASDTGTSAAPTSTETEEKLAARAKRWGLPETPEKEEESAKLTARAKRWGLSETRAAPTKRLPDSVSEAKNDLEAFLQQKAAKNGRVLPPYPSERRRGPPQRGTKRTAAETSAPADPEEEQKRKQRAERFAMKK
ncbi:hypothetical protein AK812_SmicGene38553 [Symbiodinium microadriaticum]|uniref:THO1-MOS11 C-terminal domain-containing protein n=1 Tax=Symbiodinium microadriaticum TaxID=2951 RepID=A0A1Q9CDG4_SYMMI|nr:hypothetical protein AK812_SmicGene38553 [Symbiodinium microadriaticum]